MCPDGSLKGQVLWVDEAGLLGTQDMTALLNLATQKNARLILGGDTRQHASVVRGDALRILNTVGGIQTAEVSKIYRQKNEAYRLAVEDLAKGDIRNAFDKLDGMGFIQEIDPLTPHDALVDDYVATIHKGKTVLVISPTNQQSEAVTEAIRDKLKARGVLGKKEISVPRLTNANLTDAQKSDWRNFQVGQVIQFNQNLPGIQRGSVWTVASSSEQGVFIQDAQQASIPLPTHKSQDYELYRKSEMHLAKGDRLRVTRNGFDQQKNRLNNGQLLDVVKVSKHGEIQLRNPVSQAEYTLDQEYGHLAHAYCITSHAAQGKTVDAVFISQPASTFPGTDAKQFYVSVSRGRHQARIYTDDKKQLLDYALRVGDRQSALELIGRNDQTRERVHQHIRSTMYQPTVHNEPPKAPQKPSPTKDRDYEPGF